MELTLFFNSLTTNLQLGSLLTAPVRVQGGFLHQMYQMKTDTGTYVVKMLNPNIMIRPDAMDNYAEAGRLERMIEKNGIPIIPSLIFNGRDMQEMDQQYFYVYEWFGGKVLKGKEIEKLHCHKIGEVLWHIHHIDERKEKYRRNTMNIDWDNYIGLAKEQCPLIYDLLNFNKELFYEGQMKGNRAIPKVPGVVTICHNDMDSKNVLWMKETFRIIDLECLGYSNPYLELLELALCWSGYEECSIDFELLETFIKAYFGDQPWPDIDWEAVYDSNYGRLEWLEYNIKRALMIACDTREEQELGIQQVRETVEHVIYYHAVKDDVLACMRNLLNA